MDRWRDREMMPRAGMGVGADQMARVTVQDAPATAKETHVSV